MEKKKIPGAWIPVCKGLNRKREVLAISAATGRRRYEVVGILLEFWCWADDETSDGTLPGMHLDALPLVIAETDAAFWLAVVAAGWLIQDGAGLRMPKFGRWMGQSAKRRLQEAERKRLSRLQEDIQQDDCPQDVRNLSASDADTKRPREEKRREEIGDESPNPSCSQPQFAADEPADAETNRDGTSAPDRLDDGEASGAVGEPQASTPPVLVFPTVGKGPNEWPLTAALVQELGSFYPAVDVLGECRKALAWVLANPAHRKTAKGMRNFLTKWLTRTNDRGPPAAAASPRPVVETMGERLARIRRELECKRAGMTGPNTTPHSSP